MWYSRTFCSQELCKWIKLCLSFSIFILDDSIFIIISCIFGLLKVWKNEWTTPLFFHYSFSLKLSGNQFISVLHTLLIYCYDIQNCKPPKIYRFLTSYFTYNFKYIFIIPSGFDLMLQYLWWVNVCERKSTLLKEKMRLLNAKALCFCI